MPTQTNKKGHIYFPDGAKVMVKGAADADYFDVGALNGSVQCTLNWTESVVETANAGKLDAKISNMEAAGSFTLINLDPEGISKMGGGVFSVVTADGTALTPAAQVILKNIAADTVYALEMVDSDGKAIRTAAAPVITSVMEGASAIAAETGYSIVKSGDGWGIIFSAAHETDNVTITYGSNTPIASVTVHCGSSSVVLKPYAMKIDHIDDSGKHRFLELPMVYSQSGGFQFNFKGANEDGVEEMPVSFVARVDSSRTSGRQLLSWTVESGAM